MQKYLHDHLLSEDNDGLLNDVEITLIDMTDPSDPERREQFWRTKLCTLHTLGSNYLGVIHLYNFFVLKHFTKVAIIYHVKMSVTVRQLFDKRRIVILNLVIRFIFV